MKKNIPVRILTALGGLLLLALAAAVVAEGFFRVPVTATVGAFMASRRVLAVLLKIVSTLALLILAGAAIICALPRRKPAQATSIMQKSDHGAFGITINAIEKMVLACAKKHPEIIRTDVSVREIREGIVILMNVEQAGGVSIPLSISLLQKQVSEYVKGRTGLEVMEVRVMVDNASDDHVASEFEVNDPVDRSAGARTEEREPMVEVLRQIAEMTQQAPAEEHTEPEAAPIELDEVASASEQLDEIVPVQQAEPEVFADEEKPLHQRVFGAEEEPITVAMPPEMQPAEPAEETVSEPEVQETAAPEAAAEEPVAPVVETPEEDWTAPVMQEAAEAVLTSGTEAPAETVSEDETAAEAAAEEETEDARPIG